MRWKGLLKGAVRKIVKLGSNGPFFDTNLTYLVHFGLSGFFSGVLVNQSIAPQTQDGQIQFEDGQIQFEGGQIQFEDSQTQFEDGRMGGYVFGSKETTEVKKLPFKGSALNVSLQASEDYQTC